MLSPRKAFLAGLFGTDTTNVNTTCAVDISGKVTYLADMLVKGEPGVYYDQANNSVLAFGGGYMDPFCTFQIYSLARDSWRIMPQTMKYARSGFTPCQFLNTLYLIGGPTAQVESFSLKTSTFL